MAQTLTLAHPVQQQHSKTLGAYLLLYNIGIFASAIAAAVQTPGETRRTSEQLTQRREGQQKAQPEQYKCDQVNG
jgi:hypothetical protein